MPVICVQANTGEGNRLCKIIQWDNFIARNTTWQTWPVSYKTLMYWLCKGSEKGDSDGYKTANTSPGTTSKALQWEMMPSFLSNRDLPRDMQSEQKELDEAQAPAPYSLNAADFSHLALCSGATDCSAGITTGTALAASAPSDLQSLALAKWASQTVWNTECKHFSFPSKDNIAKSYWWYSPRDIMSGSIDIPAFSPKRLLWNETSPWCTVYSQ